MPKSPTTIPVTYTGGMDSVDIQLPSGDQRRVARGEVIDIFPTDAAHLSREEWDGAGVGSAFDEPEVVVEATSPEGDQ